MKILLALCLIFLPFLEVIGQSQRDSTLIEIQPEFQGGSKDFFRYISTNMKLPKSVSKTLYQGYVRIYFWVNEDGTTVLESVDSSHMRFDKRRLSEPEKLQAQEELTTEIRRMVAAMPPWKPGTQNGKAVRVKYSMPLNIEFS